MKNKIDYIEKFFKQWIFPCRIVVPFGFYSAQTSNANSFYIDFVDGLRLMSNTIHFSGYSEIKLAKQDNIIVASSIPYNRCPITQNIDTLTLANGKYLTNGDYIKKLTHGNIICDYKDIPRILFHYILPKVPWIQGCTIANLTNEILRSLKASITCRQITSPKIIPMTPILYQISQR